MKKILFLLLLIDIFLFTNIWRKQPEEVIEYTPAPVFSHVSHAERTEEPVPAEGWLYYDQLSQEEQDTYRILYEGLASFQNTIDFPFVSDLSFIKSNAALKMDHPELWYAADPVYYMQGGSVFRAEYKVNEDTETLVHRIDEETDRIISAMPQNVNTFTKAIYIYTWLCQNTEYDSRSSAGGQDVRSVFLEHRSVCGGIASAFTLLCRKADIPCITVCGAAFSDGENVSHAWNELYIDGQWTWADATWGDQKDWINMLEFGMNDDEALALRTVSTTAGTDRIPEGTFTVPSAQSRENSWCARTGCLFDSYDRKKVSDYFHEQMSLSTERMYLQFTGHAAYEEAVNDLCASGNDPDAYFHTIVHSYYGEYKPWYFSDMPEKNAMVFSVRWPVTAIQQEQIPGIALLLWTFFA